MGWLRKTDHCDLDLKLIHDLKSPLTCIEGYSQRLLKSAEKGAIDQEALKKIRYCSQQAIGLARDLSDRRAMERGQFTLNRTEFFLEGLLAETAQGFEVICQAKGVCLEIDLPHRMTFLHADPQRIAQVVTNLLSNAVRHTPAGGTVRLGMELEGGFIKIVVEDDGDGIDPRVQTRIFDAFYQGRNPGSSGLGLSICSEIVSLHGGRIGVESEGLGKGARFFFTLPLEPVVGRVRSARTQPWAMASGLSLGVLTIVLSVLASQPAGVPILTAKAPEIAAPAEDRRVLDAPASLPVSRMLAPQPAKTPERLELGRREEDAALARIAYEFEEETVRAGIAFDGSRLESSHAGLPVYAGSGRKEPPAFTERAPAPAAVSAPPAPRVRADESRRADRSVIFYGGTILGLGFIAAPVLFSRRRGLA